MIGRVVSHYKILEEIGGGGMGTVYKARDTRLDRLVALKFLPTEWSRDADARERFTREAKAASAIDHPHICTVHDIGETDDGRMYIAMAYYPGQTLRRMFSHGAAPIDTALTIAVQAAEALAAAHKAGIVHRDIKPANILLDDRRQVKLVDFGLAKLAGEAAVTRVGTVIGTPAYMSPEQAEGRIVDHRTDLWSLGAVLYEMLVGLRAFRGESDQAVMYAVVHRQPEPINEIRPDVPEELARIITACLEKDPNRRYQSAVELLQDLRLLRGDSSPSEYPTLTVQSFSAVRRRLPLVAVLTTVAAVLMVLGLVLRDALDDYEELPLPAERTLVVLPFGSNDRSPAAAALCDGLVEQVTETLIGMQRFHNSLAVVPAPTVRSERISDARGALIAFGANLAVLGTVESESGGVLRILLELVDTQTNRAVRRRTVPWVADQGATLQNTLVSALADMLEFELDEPIRTAIATGGTRDREAQSLYMQAVGEMELEPTTENLERATDLLRQALEFDPAFSLARVALAQACWNRFDVTHEARWLDAAKTYAIQAVNENPRLPRGHLVLGLVIADTGEPGAGLAHVDRALEIDPLNVEALRARARILTAVGDRTGAEDSYEEAIALRPDNWRAVEDAGAFFYDELEFARAIGFFRRLVELRPRAAYAWSNLGAAQFRAGDWSGARLALGRSLAIGPTYEALSNLATLEFYEGRYVEAEPLYEQALAIDDGDWRVWNNFAESLRFGSGSTERAEAAYRQTAELAGRELERSPGDADLILSVASAFAAVGEDLRARKLTDEVMEAGIDDPNLMLVVVAIEEDLGERVQALVWLGRVLAAGYPLGEIEKYPGFAALREDPGFEELRRSHGTDVVVEPTTE